MSGSVNKVMLLGHLGKDPEIRTTQAGNRIAQLSLATSQSWTDKATGERKQNTQWHRIAIFNEAVVKIVDSYVKKGSKVFIEGQLETRKWTDDNGVDRYATEVTIRPYRGGVTLLDRRQNSDPGHESSKPVEDMEEMPYAADIDDDIPF